MKNFIKTTAIALAVSASFTASAAGYAVVDTARIMQQLPQREAISKMLNQEFQPRAAELQKMQKEIVELDKKRQRDAALMSPQEQTDIMRKLEQLDAQIKLKGKAFKKTNNVVVKKSKASLLVCYRMQFKRFQNATTMILL